MNENIKENPSEEKLWTGIFAKCENRFSNDRFELALPSRSDRHHLDRALRSAPHYPAQSLP